MSRPDARMIIFRSGQNRYALDLQEVAEVYDPQPEYPIPAAPPFLRRIVSIHGTLVPVLDLALYLGYGTTHPGRDLLVLNCAESSLALAVEHVERIAAYDTVLGEEPVAERLAMKKLLLADGPATVLDVSGLIYELEQQLS